MVPYVKDMTRHFSAELTLVHAYALRPVFVNRDIESVLVYSDLAYADPKIAEEARQIEAPAAGAISPPKNFPASTPAYSSRKVKRAAVIHKVLQHQGADLVMMPTRGSGIVRRFLLGSVTAKVLHDVSAAVWTSTGTAIEEHTPTVPYKSIICALDETPESEVILRAAAATGQVLPGEPGAGARARNAPGDAGNRLHALTGRI